MPRPATRPKKERRPGTDRELALERLRLLIGALNQSARAVERRTGVTNAQLFLLQQLDAAGALSVNDLAARARTQQSTVSIVVARLVRAGFAAKAKSADDGRVAVITLTAKGRRLLRHAPAPPTAALFGALEKLSQRDARALADSLGSLISALDLSLPAVTMLFEHAPPRRSAHTPSRSTKRTR